MKKKVIIIIILAALLVAGIFLVYRPARYDPNYIMKHSLRKLTLDESKDIEYTYKSEKVINRRPVHVYKFKPEESASYTFTISDIKCESESADLVLNVMDQEMADCMQLDTYYSYDEAEGSASDSVLLSRKNTYYVIVDVVPGIEDEKFKGSFKLTVTRTPEEEQEPELTCEKPVVIKAGANENGGVIFKPAEEGFYRFDTAIVNKNETGFSDISSVTSSDGKEVELYEGIGYLYSGTEYHVMVSVDEIKAKNTDVKVSSRLIHSMIAESNAPIETQDESIVYYTADRSGQLVIYTSSDGDPKASVYDENGYPVGNDDNSGAVLSENGKDYAIVLNAEEGKHYYIYTRGKFSTCTIRFGLYTGDGMSFTPDDIQELNAPEETLDEAADAIGDQAETAGKEAAENAENAEEKQEDQQ